MTTKSINRYRVVVEGIHDSTVAEMLASKLVQGSSKGGLTVRIEYIIEEVTE